VGSEDHPGGSLALGELIDEHGAALFRDLRLYYQIDLVQVVRDMKTRKGTEQWPRLLLYLIDMLPEGSEFQAALAGGREMREWGLTQYLLMAVANNITANTMIVGGVPIKDRKKFHMVEPPKTERALAAEAERKRASLMSAFGPMDGLDALPANLRKE
jgi:hypothetical protein